MLAEYRGDEPQRAYAMAKASAQQALALDPDLAEAHAAMAAVLWQFNWDWPGAERHLRLAQRGAASPMVLVWASRFRAAQGRADEALVLAERAVALAPRSPRTQVEPRDDRYLRRRLRAGRRGVPAGVGADGQVHAGRHVPGHGGGRNQPASARHPARAGRCRGSGRTTSESFDELVARASCRAWTSIAQSCQCDHDALSFA